MPIHQSVVSASVQSQNLSLTTSQQIVLGVVVETLSGGISIKTVNHHGTLCEVISRCGPLRELQPWFEADGKPSDSVPYWVLTPGEELSSPKSEPKGQGNVLVSPIAPSDREVLFRPPQWTGEPRPNAKGTPLTSRFPRAASQIRKKVERQKIGESAR